MQNHSQLPIILDGGMGRELLRIGAPFQQPEWSALALLEAPECVAQAHQNFIQAGAEVITTNTYALVPFHIGQQLFNELGASLVKQAAQLAKSAAEQSVGVQVAGCLPPVLGSYRPDLFNVAQAQPLLEVLIANQRDDIDFWLAETISSIAEAQLIKNMTAQTDKPCWIAFTINDETSAKACLRSGETAFDAVNAIAGQNVTAVLFNCSSAEVMGLAITDAKRALVAMGIESEVQIGVYANSFTPFSEDHEANAGVSDLREDLTAENYRQIAESWVAAGASILGGCCGITPEHIMELSRYKAQLLKGK
ncbi:MAG: homocysteine S-methyltransferase family protein [Pseudomonadales bacterium]|nr:homocysteine S-methyltransferase family protein [Pseudomonadales bacterium]NRA17359.1 homocysteine S-methyltransferase family protein [Oceanospirillaceae bacterium]